MRKQVYSLLVDNTPGVLSRIVDCLAGEDSVSTVAIAGVTGISRFTRITVVASGDES